MKVDTLLPERGPGFVAYGRPARGYDQYGTASTIAAIVRIGAAWARKSTVPFSIGDISLEGGGPMPSHASHQTGLDVDMRPLRKDGQNLRITWREREYDQHLTRRLIETIRENADIELILFNDPDLVRAGLCRKYAGHDNHLHLRFKAVQADRTVRDVQNGLARLGYLKTAEVTGIRDAKTIAATKVFQRDNGLEVDGIAGPLTRKALSARLAKADKR